MRLTSTVPPLHATTRDVPIFSSSCGIAGVCDEAAEENVPPEPMKVYDLTFQKENRLVPFLM
jgi:hypothetical protein